MVRAYKPNDLKKLWYRSGGRCAVCKLELALAKSDILIGNVAHIVAHSPGGPRAYSRAAVDRNDYQNLILLCPTHHAEIDKDTESWTIASLRELKSEHENWVRTSLSWRDGPISTRERRYLLIVSGPSGVGKDVIVNRLLRRLEGDGHVSTFLRRFTTRGPRTGETPGHPYTYLGHEEFHSKVQLGVVSCVHTSFGFTYGCDSHFSQEAPAGSIVLHTMRNLSFLRQMKYRAEARGLSVLNVLVTADQTTLLDRILQRTSSPEEKAARIESTRQDLDWIARHQREVRSFFDLQLSNSDDQPLRKTMSTLYRHVTSMLSH